MNGKHSNKGRRLAPKAGKAAGQRREAGGAARPAGSHLEGSRVRAAESGEPMSRGVKILLIVCVVLLAIALGLFIFYKAWVKPPDIDNSGIGQTSTTTIPNTPTTTGTTLPGQTTAATNQTTTTTEEIREFTRKEGAYTILVVGNDDGNGNTDTIMVGMLDTKAGKLNVVNLPRDTMVNVSWSIKKINSVLANKGIDGLKAELRELMGFTVDCYCIVDLKAFVKLVEAIDGVDFYIPQDMEYYDPDQNLDIDFKKGMTHLRGNDALKVVRFRSGYANGDIGRIETTQKFLMAVAKKVFSTISVSRVREYAEIFNKYVETDMDMGTLVWFGQEFLKLSSKDITFTTLPANYDERVNGLSYVSVKLDEWLEYLNGSLNPYEQEIEARDVAVLTRSDSGELYVTDGSPIEGGIDSFWKKK